MRNMRVLGYFKYSDERCFSFWSWKRATVNDIYFVGLRAWKTKAVILIINPRAWLNTSQKGNMPYNVAL